MTHRGLATLVASILLGGCALQPQTEPTPTPAVEPSPVYVPGELNRESVYELLAAEIAGQQHQFDQTLSFYMNQAERSHDPQVAERATRIAQFMRDSEAVLTAAKIWADADPGNPEPLHIMSGILLQEGRFDEAMPLVEQLLRDDSAEEVLLIGSKSSELPPETARLYDQLLARISAEQPKRLDLILTRALLKRRQGDDAGALALLDAGLKVEPGQPDLTVQKVEILRDQKHTRRALKIVDAALAQNPGHKQLSVQRAQLLLASNPKAAVRQIERLAKRYGDDPQLQYYLALLLLDHKQYDASRNLLNGLLQTNPRNTTLHLYLGIIDETQGRTESAIAHYQAVTSGPNRQQAYARTLNLLAAPTDRPRVEAIIAEGIDADPRLATPLTLMLADWLNQHDATQDAIALLNERLNSEPDNVDLLYTRALMIEPLDSAQMLADLERALALDPENGMIKNALGYSLTLYTDQLQRAHTLISQALEQYPDDAAILDSMGWVLHRLGRHEEALTFLRRAYAAFSDPEVAGHLIQVLWAAGHQKEAQTLLQSSLQQAPDSAELREAAAAIGAQ